METEKYTEEWLIDLLLELGQESNAGTPVNRILEYAQALNWSMDILDETMDDAISQGVIYCPAMSCWKVDVTPSIVAGYVHREKERKEFVHYAKKKLLDHIVDRETKANYYDLKIMDVPRPVYEQILDILRGAGITSYRERHSLGVN
jgi:hypothetical protein